MLKSDTAKQLQNIDMSESLNFKTNVSFLKQNPTKEQLRQKEQLHDQILENIRMKQYEPGFESYLISKDIAEHIQRFQNANCFDHEPSTLTFRAKKELKKKAEEDLKR